MRDALYLYGRYISASVRGQMAYKASFIMLTLVHFVITGIEFITIIVLFARFGTLEGWSIAEVSVFYGLVAITFSLSDAAARGFDLFADMIKAGDFDRLLVRPRATALQLAGQELTLRRIGRFTQGLVVFLWGASQLHLAWNAARIALTLAAILGGACLFYGIIVLQATLAFWTTETLEIVNSVTYGGVQTTQYPLAIYRQEFQRFFTYVIPLACTCYFPIVAILGRPDPLGSPEWFRWVSPAVGVLFLVLSLQVWKVGVRHYTSTGS